MKELIVRQYIADAFTDTVFKGNPAAICLLQNWISDEMMQNIAKENRLSETAKYRQRKSLVRDSIYCQKRSGL